MADIDIDALLDEDDEVNVVRTCPLRRHVPTHPPPPARRIRNREHKQLLMPGSARRAGSAARGGKSVCPAGPVHESGAARSWSDPSTGSRSTPGARVCAAAGAAVRAAAQRAAAAAADGAARRAAGTIAAAVPSAFATAAANAPSANAAAATNTAGMDMISMYTWTHAGFAQRGSVKAADQATVIRTMPRDMSQASRSTIFIRQWPAVQHAIRVLRQMPDVLLR